MSYIAQNLDSIIKELCSENISEDYIKILCDQLANLDITYLYKIYYKVWELCNKPNIDEFGRDFFVKKIKKDIDDTYIFNQIREDAVRAVFNEYDVELKQCKLCSLKTMEDNMVYSDKTDWCVYLVFTHTNIPVLLITPLTHKEKLDYLTAEQSSKLITMISFSTNILMVLSAPEKRDYCISYSTGCRISGSNHVGIMISSSQIKPESINISQINTDQEILVTNYRNINLQNYSLSDDYEQLEFSVKLMCGDIEKIFNLQQQMNKL